MASAPAAIISVVVPTYKRARLLRRCLESLFADDLAPVREVVLVVHDDDAEGLAEAVWWKERRPLVRLVFTKHASRAAARNAAAAVCEGDWCYFLDDDTVIPPGALRRLERAIAEHPEAAAVGGPNRLPEGAGLFERCVDDALASRLGAGTMRARYAGLAAEAWVDERSLIACNLAVRTPALRRGLAFPPSLDYGEETFLLAGLRLEGRRLLHAPQVWVYHHRRGDLPSFCLQAFRSGAGRARQTRLLPRSFFSEFLGPPALVVLAAAAPFSSPWAWGPLALYSAACLGQGIATGVGRRSPAAALWTALLLPAGHLSFGLGFFLFPLAGSSSRHRRWPAKAAQWALRARRVPGLAALGAAYYAASLACLRAWLALARLPINGLWLRRGLARADWVPGVSDVDLAVELPVMSHEHEAAWLDRWHQGWRRLRALFPILGEVQIATRGEWRFYLRHGDLRSRELPREVRPILRRDFPSLEPDASNEPAWPEARRSLDVWSEQLHAYVRLAQLYFDRDGDLRAGFNARKCLLDIARYARLLGDQDGLSAGSTALTRAETALLCRQGGLAQALARLDRAQDEDVGLAVESAFLEGSRALEESARGLLERLPTGEPCAVETTEPPSTRPEEEEAFETLCRKLERAAEGRPLRVLHDNVHHCLIGVPPDGVSARTMRDWRDLRRSEAALSQSPLPLGPFAFRLALWAPYAEDPLRSLSVLAVLGAGDGVRRAQAASSGRSLLLRRHILSLWNMDSAGVAAPARALADSLLRESLSHILVNWRSLDGPGRREDDYHRWIYLYGRVLSLRLYAAEGRARPSFPLEPLARRFAEAFPEERRWIESRVLHAAAIGAWREHRAFLARQLREAAAGMPAIRPAGSGLPSASPR